MAQSTFEQLNGFQQAARVQRNREIIQSRRRKRQEAFEFTEKSRRKLMDYLDQLPVRHELHETDAHGFLRQ